MLKKRPSLTQLALLLAASGLAGEGSGNFAFADGNPPPLLPGNPGALLGGGEGGESGEAGEDSAPTTYKLNSTDPQAFAYDAKPAISAYADRVAATYAEALAGAERLAAAIDALLAAPSAESLAAARAAWLEARPAYSRSEAYRFYGGPIDDADGPEGRLNAWPLNEAFIDYVAGDPDAGLIDDPGFTISASAILGKDQALDESDVATGYHAIEFLLWGQDGNKAGPGDRPYSDYRPGEGHNDRRRAYLSILARQLVTDLRGLVADWDRRDPHSYAAFFLALDQREALGRILNGMAKLAGHELAGERLAVALDSGSPEDEQSCFSDNTRADFIAGIAGLAAIYGDLAPLIGNVDEAANQRILAEIAAATAEAAALPQPFESLLVLDKATPERQNAENLVTHLTALAKALQDAGRSLGVFVIAGF